MSGYMFAMSECANCQRLCSYNPDLVPSMRVNGVREPICRHCVEVANPIRIARGLVPIVLLRGAYEPAECV